VIPLATVGKLSLGDFAAKSLAFLVSVYLARLLGAPAYGVLEFARALLVYALLLGDAGLDTWATREAARGGSAAPLAGRVVGTRAALGLLAGGLLLALIPALPDYPGLGPVLALFGLAPLLQGLSLRWLFMGRQRMGIVALALVGSQAVYAGAVAALVRGPGDLAWVPAAHLLGEATAAAVYAGALLRAGRVPPPPLRLHGVVRALRGAAPIAASQAFGLLNYNFDSLLLGVVVGPAAVGSYAVAYRPVTMVLALPLTYFVALLPVLSRAHAGNPAAFRDTVARSTAFSVALALPIGVGGTLLADPVIATLFGPAFATSAPVLRILCWSAVLVIARGTLCQALNAAGRSPLDLRCALASSALNVGLNLLLIPRYGTIGAAAATVAGDVLWLAMAWHMAARHVTAVSPVAAAARPALAAVVMAATLAWLPGVPWLLRAALGLGAYVGTLALLGSPLRPPVGASGARPAAASDR
jgi:O-antigen/teichoic acid export membrane protein